MNIATTNLSETQSSTSNSASKNQKSESDKSFLEEFNTIKQETSGETKVDKKSTSVSIGTALKNTPAENDTPTMTNNVLSATSTTISKQQDVQDKITSSNNQETLTGKTSEKKEDLLKSKAESSKSELESDLQTLMYANVNLISLNNISGSKSSDKTNSLNEIKLDMTNSLKMDDNDTLFFANLVKDNDMSMNNVAQKDFSQVLNSTQDIQNLQDTQKSAQVSQTLMNSLSDAMKTGQPVRIDFDKDVSVIIKVDKQGKISADFIPGDKAVENYLRNNIPLLKQKFEEQNLAYNDLNYRQSRGNQQQEQRNQRNNKENKDE